MDWSQVLATALPTVVLVGGTLLRTHGKVRRVLAAVEAILSAVTTPQPEKER